MADRTALVTGARSGLGSAVVDAFLAAIDPGEAAQRDDATQTAVHNAAAHIRGLLRQPAPKAAAAASAVS